jgi:uncharacterized membrane-anchored protein
MLYFPQVRLFRAYAASALLAIAVSFTIPTGAQATDQQGHTRPFTEPLALSRGSLLPQGKEVYLLEPDQICPLTQKFYAWTESQCRETDAISFYYLDDLDTLIVSKPTNSGYINTEALLTQDSRQAIRDIQTAFENDIVIQTKDSGIPITFDRWIIPPEFDPTLNAAYLAYSVHWDGRLQTNIKAILLDRKGSIVFLLIPLEQNLSSQKLRQLVQRTVGNYRAAPGQSYADFTPGDKVDQTGHGGPMARIFSLRYDTYEAPLNASSLLSFFAFAVLELTVLAFVLLGVWIFRRNRRKKPRD